MVLPYDIFARLTGMWLGNINNALVLNKNQVGRGHWTVYNKYNLSFIGLFQTFPSIIIIYRKGIFVYHYWG